MRREELNSDEAIVLDAAVKAAHRRIIDERLAEYDPTTEDLRTLNEVCDRLLGVSGRTQDFV